MILSRQIASSFLPTNKSERVVQFDELCLVLKKQCNAGRPGLALAVSRCGGFKAVAQHLGLSYKETRGRKPKAA